MTAISSLATRQQVILERLKAGEVKKLATFLKQAADVIRRRLSQGELTDMERGRAELQLQTIRTELTAIYGKAGQAMTDGMKDYADFAGGYETRALDAVLIQGVDVVTPAANQIYAAAIARPMTSGKTATLLEPFISEWSSRSVTAIENTVRQGFFEGRTNQQIVKDIIGTKANGYQDGIIDVTRRSAETVVRTSIQHVAQVARNEVYAANADIVARYEWVSTLDNRTSPSCRALDGREFEIGKGPLPPLHPNCRSSTVPVINNKYIRETLRQGATRVSVDGPVPANMSYYEWLKTQPVDFQNEAIGPVRAQLLRDGGLSAQRFQELQLGRNFEPLTLDEMKKLEPVAFNRAGL